MSTYNLNNPGLGTGCYSRSASFWLKKGIYLHSHGSHQVVDDGQVGRDADAAGDEDGHPRVQHVHQRPAERSVDVQTHRSTGLDVALDGQQLLETTWSHRFSFLMKIRLGLCYGLLGYVFSSDCSRFFKSCTVFYCPLNPSYMLI